MRDSASPKGLPYEKLKNFKTQGKGLTLAAFGLISYGDLCHDLIGKNP